MRIDAVTVENYKVFLDPQSIEFSPGFNLLVGSNNSGKTTVLDVLDLNLGLNDPHRSVRTVPEYGGATPPMSQFEMAISTRYEELRRFGGWNQVYLPIAEQALRDNNRTEADVRSFTKLNADFVMRAEFGGVTQKLHMSADDVVTGTFDVSNGAPKGAAILQYATPSAEPSVSIGSHSGQHQWAQTYLSAYAKRIYRFAAQRKPGTEMIDQGDGVLDREALRLPFCINHLASNDSYGHKTLCALINRIFPSVRWIEAPPIGGLFRLRCLPCEPSARRDDLAIPIAKMGTGLGNVIAMLYVALTTREPQVIAIDEPNAFLHPRALRELLAILESVGAQHQYIMTAHSPDVITSVNLASIILLDFDGTCTKAKQVNEIKLFALRGHLADLGIRITDLHSRDRVLWVEGQTEELLMPDLLRYACPEIAASTAVLRVERTGTFSRKGVDPSEVANLYSRLSASSALVPPMVCILLDAEERPRAERERITADSNESLRFLPRRMLECYVLNADAIAAQLTALGCTTSVSFVEKALADHVGTDLTTANLADVHGANVLKNVFSTLSASTIEFQKTRDVPSLVAWIIRHKAEELVDLRSFLREVFGV
jgi:AAA ATPase domain/AAA domain, putative AbiEii toxin, Type IV TA system